MMGGILGLVVLVLDIWAILQVFKSSMTSGKKILWTLLIFFLPVVGLVLYFLIGRK